FVPSRPHPARLSRAGARFGADCAHYPLRLRMVRPPAAAASGGVLAYADRGIADGGGNAAELVSGSPRGNLPGHAKGGIVVVLPTKCRRRVTIRPSPQPRSIHRGQCESGTHVDAPVGQDAAPSA